MARVIDLSKHTLERQRVKPEAMPPSIGSLYDVVKRLLKYIQSKE